MLTEEVYSNVEISEPLNLQKKEHAWIREKRIDQCNLIKIKRNDKLQK